MNPKEHQDNKSFSSSSSRFIFDYEKELVSIWKLKLASKISEVLID